MINISCCEGRLTRDPEIRQTKTGKPFASFCVAVPRPYKQNGEYLADYIDCEAWGKNATLIERVKKGNMVSIEGSLQTSTFKDAEGKSRKKLVLTVNRVHFLPQYQGQEYVPDIEEVEEEE